MYTELQLDMLVADALTLLERKAITLKQFDFRIKKYKKMRGSIKNGK